MPVYWIPRTRDLKDDIVAELLRNKQLKKIQTPQIAPVETTQQWTPQPVVSNRVETQPVEQDVTQQWQPQQRVPQATQISAITPQGTTPAVSLPNQGQTQPWQVALNVFNAPFKWIGEHITQPFGAYATAPFTPSVPGTENLPWTQRERAEYKAWEEPEFTMPWGGKFKPTKGLVEMIPWLAFSALTGGGGITGQVARISAEEAGLLAGAGVSGKLIAGAGAKGLAGILGNIGSKAGQIEPILRGLGYAVEYSPWGLVDKATGKVISLATKGFGKRLTVGDTLETARQKWDSLLPDDKLDDVAEAGLPKEVAKKALDEMTPDEQIKLTGIEPQPVVPAKVNIPPVGETPITKAVSTPPTNVPPVIKQPKVPSEFDRFWEMISGRKGQLTELERQQALTSARVDLQNRITDRLNKIDPTKLTEELYSKIWREESGPLLGNITKLGFSQEFLDEGTRHIREVLLQENLSEFEVKSTITAFKNALDGLGVPRKLGTAGGSAYTRLARVFGQEVVDILSDVDKLGRMTDPKGVTPELLNFIRGLKGNTFGQGQGNLLQGIEEPALGKIQQPLTGEAPWTPVPSPDIRTQGQKLLALLRKRLPVDFNKASQEDLVSAVRSLSSDEKMELFKLARVGGYNMNLGQPTSLADYLMTLPAKDAAKELLLLPADTRLQVTKKLMSLERNVPEALNIMRAVLSAGDMSAVMRQSAIATIRHPIAALKNIVPSWKAMFSSDYSDDIARMIQSDPSVQKFMRPSLTEQLYIAPNPDVITNLLQKEEAFMSNAVMKIPVLGNIIKASNRSFVTFLNLMRQHLADDTENGMFEMARKAGMAVTDIDYSEMARLINIVTGRGDLKLLGMDFTKQGALLNGIFFSPRYIMSRLQWPTMLFSPSEMARKETVKQMGTFLAAGGGVLAAVKLAGGKVELDPRSADFGKVKIGNTRLDMWTGYAQYLRFLAQLTLAQRKTAGGQITEANRWETVLRFAQSKTSPAVGLLTDILKGESYMGEEVNLDTKNLRTQVFRRLTPLFIQDMWDAIGQEGIVGGLVATPSFFGVGVTTYINPADKLRNKLAQESYGMSWEDVGKQMGRATQLQLEQSSPDLQKLVEKENEDYSNTITGKADVNNRWRNQAKLIEQGYRDIILKATNEFRQTQDGTTYNEKIHNASANRRAQYDLLNIDPLYSKYTQWLNRDLTQQDYSRMNEQDIARHEYFKALYSKDMYDEFGNYRYDYADQIREQFVKVYGQALLDYVEDYQGVKEADMPAEYKMFRQASRALQPYWDIQNQVYEVYGEPQTENQIKRTDAIISKMRKNLRRSNPEINQALELLYSR